MTIENIITIIAAVLGSSLIQYLISRHDSRAEKANENMKTLSKLERDSVRLQILFMMKFQPERKEKILEIAEYYFHKLKGDWYMTDIFSEWLQENGINIPGWFTIRQGEESGNDNEE